MSTKMRIRIGTITLLGLFVALGYRGEASAQTASVSISGFAFQPPTLNVAVGTTVQWVNHDTAAHTASSNTGAFDSGVLNQNGSYSFTFNQAGTFSYHCAIHPYMTGQIVVGAQAATSTSVPTSAPSPTLTSVPTSTATVPSATPSPTSAPLETPTSTATGTSTPTVVPATATAIPTATAVVVPQLSAKTSGSLHPGKTGALRVTVRDDAGYAVNKATVAVDGRNVGISPVSKKRTNGKGQASFTLHPAKAGKIKISVSRSGYKSRALTVPVR